MLRRHRDALGWGRGCRFGSNLRGAALAGCAVRMLVLAGDGELGFELHDKLMVHLGVFCSALSEDVELFGSCLHLGF